MVLYTLTHHDAVAWQFIQALSILDEAMEEVLYARIVHDCEVPLVRRQPP